MVVSAIKHRLVIFLAVALSLLVMSGGIVSANGTGSDLTTSPIFVDLNSAPGKTVSTNLEVQNNSRIATFITVKLEKFKAYGVNGQAAIYSPPANDPSINWVHFSKNNFLAQPNVWNTVNMTVNLPTSAALGYYYAVLFSATNNAKITAKNAIYKSANAIFVLVNANNGHEYKNLQVTNFSTTKKLYSFLPVNFNVTVRNNGDVFLQPEGDIYISRSPGGKTIDTINLNPGLNNVLPDSSRVFTATWDNGFPVFQDKRVANQIVSNAKGQPIKYLDWNFSKPISDFRLGK
jgi:hypothetical protein